jgi:hypothetical protein
MVLAALAAGSAASSAGAPPPAPSGGERAPALCALVFADRLADVAGVDAARAWLAKVPREATAPHDPLAGPLAVDLAARGALAPSELSPGQKLELAARRREPPPPMDRHEEAGAGGPGAGPRAPLDERAELDAKHAFLLAALAEPTGPVARVFAARLASAADEDPLVAFAIARVAIASAAGAPAGSAGGGGGAAGAGAGAFDHLRRAAAAAPGDPLVLSALVELAKRLPAAGREDLASVRARLLAVARTPAERALAAD